MMPPAPGPYLGFGGPEQNTRWALKLEKMAYFHLIIKLQNIHESYTAKNRLNLNAKRVKSSTQVTN